MGGSKSAVSEDFAAVHLRGSATTEADIDIEDRKVDEAVNSPVPTELRPFQVGQKVLALHKQRLYEAKVQNIEFEINKWKYYVHYLGWKKKWDEWLFEDCLMKYTEENLKKQRELNKQQDMEKANTGGASQVKQKVSSGARGRKRKTESVQKENDTLLIEKRVNIHIPPVLRKQLIDDCELRTQLGKLVRLPCSPNVDDILNKYYDYRQKKDGMICDSVREILNGLRSYFDKALPAMLLYKSERQQYEESMADNVPPSAIYGAEHLLRLFVKLPEILYSANIEELTLSELQRNLVDLLKFLSKNDNMFSSACPSPDDLDATVEKQE